MSDHPLAGEALLDALERGEVRVARPEGDGWVVEGWVKEGILEIFRTSALASFEGGGFSFVDKETLPARRFAVEDGVRVVPGGTTVRRGSYVARGTILMPPAYVNVGAWIGEGTMIDSHALVGSCAQVGARVHVSAGAQLGGVLEPIGARPVIVEDDVLVGGQSGLYEGVLVRRGAVIGAGTILTGSTRVYDLVHERELTRAGDEPLEIPAGAVVIPGGRPARGDYAARQGLSAACALIVKYRDAATGRATALEDALR